MLSLGCISLNRLAVTVSQIKCRQLFSRTRDRNLIKTSNIFVDAGYTLFLCWKFQTYNPIQVTGKCWHVNVNLCPPKLSSFVVKILKLSNNVKDSAVQSNKASKEAANIGILNKKILTTFKLSYLENFLWNTKLLKT